MAMEKKALEFIKKQIMTSKKIRDNRKQRR